MAPVPGLFDPEQIGFVLRGVVDVPTGNFQDLPLWRRQVSAFVAGLLEEYERPVLAPMTLVDPRYVDEIFGAVTEAGFPVHHFFLDVSPQVLAQRIDSRTVAPDDAERDRAAKAWCKEQIPRCVAAAASLPSDTVGLDGERPVVELADEVLARVGGPGPVGA